MGTRVPSYLEVDSVGDTMDMVSLEVGWPLGSLQLKGIGIILVPLCLALDNAGVEIIMVNLEMAP